MTTVVSMHACMTFGYVSTGSSTTNTPISLVFTSTGNLLRCCHVGVASVIGFGKCLVLCVTALVTCLRTVPGHHIDRFPGKSSTVCCLRLRPRSCKAITDSRGSLGGRIWSIMNFTSASSSLVSVSTRSPAYALLTSVSAFRSATMYLRISILVCISPGSLTWLICRRWSTVPNTASIPQSPSFISPQFPTNKSLGVARCWFHRILSAIMSSGMSSYIHIPCLLVYCFVCLLPLLPPVVLSLLFSAPSYYLSLVPSACD